MWFDAYVLNVDRTPRNANLLMWHRKLWLIDHGASLFFHHSWANLDKRDHYHIRVHEHILLPFANGIEAADESMMAAITEDVIKQVVELVPDNWIEDGGPFSSTAEYKSAYVDYLTRRLEAPRGFVEEIIRAR